MLKINVRVRSSKVVVTIRNFTNLYDQSRNMLFRLLVINIGKVTLYSALVSIITFFI